MTALANTLQRVWSAKGRLPRLTGRGESDFSGNVSDAGRTAIAQWAQSLGELYQLARRTAPTVVVIALRLFR